MVASSRGAQSSLIDLLGRRLCSVIGVLPEVNSPVLGGGEPEVHLTVPVTRREQTQTTLLSRGPRKSENPAETADSAGPIEFACTLRAWHREAGGGEPCSPPGAWHISPTRGESIRCG